MTKIISIFFIGAAKNKNTTVFGGFLFLFFVICNCRFYETMCFEMTAPSGRFAYFIQSSELYA